MIALFADTIIASFLPTGAVASLYYADRIYQLPLGVIGHEGSTVIVVLNGLRALRVTEPPGPAAPHLPTGEIGPSTPSGTLRDGSASLPAGRRNS